MGAPEDSSLGGRVRTWVDADALWISSGSRGVGARGKGQVRR